MRIAHRMNHAVCLY